MPLTASFISPVLPPTGRQTLPRARRPRRPAHARTSALLIEFAASDFEIRRLVGQQGYATITDWEYYGTRSPTAPTRTVQPSEPAVRLYDARIVGGNPRLYNARVVLKEFLGAGVQLGVNEASAYRTLYEADSAGGRGINPDVVPVATLLGSFIADDSFGRARFAAAWGQRFPKSPEPPSPGAPFLVFRWEGMQTALNAAASPNDDVVGTRMLDSIFPGNMEKRKGAYVKALINQALLALLYLQGTGGMVHRSIGLASIMVNTTEHRLASSLQVKIRDLGFAQPVSSLVSGTDLENARKAGAVSPAEIARYHFAEDIYALGYAFVQLIFSIFSGRPTTQDTFKKLFEDTFELDIVSFRDYCNEDPEWSSSVRFLDQEQQEGWKLLRAMLTSRTEFNSVSLANLSESRFLNT